MLSVNPSVTLMHPAEGSAAAVSTRSAGPANYPVSHCGNYATQGILLLPWQASSPCLP